MASRYLTGLDWSGDPGDPRKSNKANTHFAVATCTVDLHFVDEVSDRLSDLRQQLGYGPEHVFHYANCHPADRNQFFETIRDLPLIVSWSVIDKSAWTPSYFQATTGPERIRSEVVGLLRQLPDSVVKRQKLLVDMTRDEKAFVRRIRQDLSIAMSADSRESFAKVVARPDHRTDAFPIQIADMFAGEARALRGELVLPHGRIRRHRSFVNEKPLA